MVATTNNTSSGVPPVSRRQQKKAERSAQAESVCSRSGTSSSAVLGVSSPKVSGATYKGSVLEAAYTSAAKSYQAVLPRDDNNMFMLKNSQAFSFLTSCSVQEKLNVLLDAFNGQSVIKKLVARGFPVNVAQRAALEVHHRTQKDVTVADCTRWIEDQPDVTSLNV